MVFHVFRVFHRLQSLIQKGVAPNAHGTPTKNPTCSACSIDRRLEHLEYPGKMPVFQGYSAQGLIQQGFPGLEHLEHAEHRKTACRQHMRQQLIVAWQR